MQKDNGGILYSASDLVNFLECEHLTTLNRIHLDTPLQKTEDSDEAKLIQAKGLTHEKAVFEKLKASHARVIDIAASSGDLEQKAANTRQAMQAGYDIIYQATLRKDSFLGHADFLRKISRPSQLGDWSYEVLDTKLSKTPKASYLVQLGFYSSLVEDIQGVPPQNMVVILGDGREAIYRCVDYTHYLNQLTRRFLARVQGAAQATYPVPCEKCSQCKWSGLCEQRRLDDDHLWQVANITRLQIRRLEAAGVTTLKALATLPQGQRIAKMPLATQEKLHHQARLQFAARETGQRLYELLPRDPNTDELRDGLRGFERLPRPDQGDLFFDMEGDPLEEGGLEYLFGLYFLEKRKFQFKAFWAHSRAEEKQAFEAFMDFVTARLRQYPDAHIYHYAHYEETALKKLMSLHGTREAEVDNLLRAQKLIDLYKVVREGIRVSEPRYSIKNIEHFYLEKRTSEVKDAGASIVYYERWKTTQDPKLLKDIENYNYDDVRSTHELHQWLLKLRPAEIEWATPQEDAPEIDELTEQEERLIPYRKALIESSPNDPFKELTFQLLSFHRRADKSLWWAIFARKGMSEDELRDDRECLAGLTPDPANPPRLVKRSMQYTWLFPEQESKLKTGDSATITASAKGVNELVVDEEARRVSFKLGPSNTDPLPEPLALGPGKPIDNKKLVDAVFRFADSLIDNTHQYPAIEAYLRRDIPRIRGRAAGANIVPADSASIDDIIAAVSNLDNSYLFIQGPPGAGKTWTGSHVIVALMQQGKKVGVSSNSHKAISNLLAGVEKVAKAKKFTFSGLKKSDTKREETCFNGDFITDVDNKGDEVCAALANGAKLAAGTAWLFADDMDCQLDYLFIDEAGQIAVANLVAMATSARNIILLGDQMQLSQPVQGVHPGHSGDSSLDYLLDDKATISPDRGIFLGTTWRMHPDICRFISEAVYESRLYPEPANQKQRLLLKPDAHPALKASGLHYLPIEHDACAQRSEEEAALVSSLVESLLQQSYRDRKGKKHPITLADILVVSPYNMQVNLLKKILPEGARVGTVDKFQGQEAEVVIISMATSSGDDLPRDIEFLYSKNRLNVAISRARSLALFIANPALMSIRCKTPEQMGLVNILCWVGEVGGEPDKPCQFN
ncbi:MAG: TM0106 family RecB-like putative nuclease [Azonexus sp.]|jgi:uncharacterized protein|nr:TM0106 family RecB-like putative nuclease [Azonexus sp.]